MDAAPGAPPPPAAGAQQPNAPAPACNAAAYRLAVVPLVAWFLISLPLSPWLIASTFFFCNDVETGHAIGFTPVALNSNCDLTVATPSGNYTVTQRCSTIAQCKEPLQCPNLQLALNHYQPKRCSYIVSGPDGDADTQLPQAMSWRVVNAWMQLSLAAVIWMLLVAAAVWAAVAVSAVHSRWLWTGAYSRLHAADTELTHSSKVQHDISDAAATELEQAEQQGGNAGAVTHPLGSFDEEDVSIGSTFFGILLLFWLVVSAMMSPEFVQATFSCNEILHGSATSVQRADAFTLQGAMCTVGLQLDDSSTHTVDLPCSKVTPCESNLSACANLQVAANHISPRLCLRIMIGGGYNNEDAHESVSWLSSRFPVLWDSLGLALLLACIRPVLCFCCNTVSAAERHLRFLFPSLCMPLGGRWLSDGGACAERVPGQASTHASPSNDTSV